MFTLNLHTVQSSAIIGIQVYETIYTFALCKPTPFRHTSVFGQKFWNIFRAGWKKWVSIVVELMIWCLFSFSCYVHDVNVSFASLTSLYYDNCRENNTATLWSWGEKLHLRVRVSVQLRCTVLMYSRTKKDINLSKLLQTIPVAQCKDSDNSCIISWTSHLTWQKKWADTALRGLLEVEHCLRDCCKITSIQRGLRARLRCFSSCWILRFKGSSASSRFPPSLHLLYKPPSWDLEKIRSDFFPLCKLFSPSKPSVIT